MMEILGGLVKEGSFNWPGNSGNSFDKEFEEMGRSPSGKRKSIPELSSVANVIICRCSRILDISMDDLQTSFNEEAADPIKQPSCYARNFLEYCCFKALPVSTQVDGHLANYNFRRLTFDMMLAWESPAASDQSVVKSDEESTVGIDSFSRIAPAVPIIADVITCTNLFNVLADSTNDRLYFSTYENYLSALDRVAKNMKNHSESSHLSSLRSDRKERILDMDGTLTKMPVLEHLGMSIWPGRLTLTDHALYFETLRVMNYDKPQVYDLEDNLKQVVKPDLTGPLGSRLFDKGVMYNSTSLSEPIIFEFPELTGHSRRDHWLSVIREILYAHDFIRKFNLSGVSKEETLSKAVLGILRLQAIDEMHCLDSLQPDSLLMFNVSDQLPEGDLILEALAKVASMEIQDKNYDSKSGNKGGMYSLPSLMILSNLGLVSNNINKTRLLVGELVVGKSSYLEKAVEKSRSKFKNTESAKASVDSVKVDGIDTNVAVMKELLYPITELGKHLSNALSWNEPISSLVFCFASSYIIWSGYLRIAFALIPFLLVIFMVLTRFCNCGKSMVKVKVKAPPPMNAMEQLIALKTGISQLEQFIQDANIFLLKSRALLLSILPQATDKVALVLVLFTSSIVFLPVNVLLLCVFLEMSTRYSPPRKSSTERLKRRLKEWWFSIPAAPVLLERSEEDKNK